MLNLDTEEEGAIYVGCAGGLDTVLTTPVTLVPAGAGKAFFRVAVRGLRGGHSGVDIHEGRVNALKVLARALWPAVGSLGVEVASLEGGSKRNAIPREAFATVAVDPAREGELRAALAGLEAEVKAEAGAFDPGLSLALEPAAGRPARRLRRRRRPRASSDSSTRRLTASWACRPTSRGSSRPRRTSRWSRRRVPTVVVATSQRSSVESAKKDAGADGGGPRRALRVRRRAGARLPGLEAEHRLAPPGPGEEGPRRRSSAGSPR